MAAACKITLFKLSLGMLLFVISITIKLTTMKKLSLLAASALLFVGTASAQLKFGPEVGLNINKLDYDAAGDESTNMGLRIGAVMDIGFSKFSVQPGIFYSMKGGEADHSIGAASIERNTNLGYLSVPLLLQYKIAAGPGRVFLGLGPVANIAVTGETKTSTTVAGGTSKTEEQIDFGSDPGQFDRTDIGLMFNIGYETDMGLFIRPFYEMGMSNIYNAPAASTIQTIKNSTFGLSVGWWFGDN